jgi:hypothetical protein
MIQRNDTALDFTVSDHGTIVLLKPCTVAANDWVERHLPEEVQHWGAAIAVDRRCFPAIYHGIREDGLVIA